VVEASAEGVVGTWIGRCTTTLGEAGGRAGDARKQ
jgi:hypothetical protein